MNSVIKRSPVKDAFVVHIRTTIIVFYLCRIEPAAFLFSQFASVMPRRSAAIRRANGGPVATFARSRNHVFRLPASGNAAQL
jgi:hypothetical protein